MPRFLLLALPAFMFAAGMPQSACGDFTLSIDPRGAYLRANGETPPDAVPIDLLPLGIRPGDTITITRLGDFQRSSSAPFDADIFLDITAVFSTSSTLGPPGDLNRVMGAVAAGLDFVTVPTFIGELPTDIPEDFEVSNFDGTVASVTVQVPVGGRFLFVATADSFFSDNTDPDGDFGVQITVVPEPGSFLLLGIGAVTLLGGGWRGRRSKGTACLP